MEEGEGNSKFSQTNPHNDCSHLAAHTEKKNKQNFQNKHSSVNLYLLFTIYDIIFWTCITSEEKRLQISDYETSPENTANQVKGTEDALVQGLWHGGNGKGSPKSNDSRRVFRRHWCRQTMLIYSFCCFSLGLLLRTMVVLFFVQTGMLGN